MTVITLCYFDKTLIKIENNNNNDLLTAFVDRFEIPSDDIGKLTHSAQLVLTTSSSAILACWHQHKSKPLNFFIDVEKFAAQQKTFPAAKQGAFNQALGKKSKIIIDATGGWGADALLMCSQGYQVTIIERNPVMALLLKDAMHRLAQTEWAYTYEVIIPKVIEVDAIDFFARQKQHADCVYLDPMFPAKRKKSAATNKNMQLLQWLIGQDQDANELLSAVMSQVFPRIAVKRPDYALPLLTNNECETIYTTTQFASKLVHYDVYLKVKRP